MIKWEPFQYQNAVHATKLLTDGKKNNLKKKSKIWEPNFESNFAGNPLGSTNFFCKAPIFVLKHDLLWNPLIVITLGQAETLSEWCCRGSSIM